MKYVITLDATNTTTRAFLWEDDKSVAVAVENAGLQHETELKKKAAKACIENVMQKRGLSYEQLDKIVACGMLTSGIGLYELPHIKAPAGLEDYAKGIKKVLIEEVAPVPISFIPGMKNDVTDISLDNFEAMDIMRGEEIDCAAILSTSSQKGPCMVVLSEYYHTKFISVNAAGQMTGCLTTITGDLLSCITNKTDIGGCVDGKFLEADEYNKEMILRGYRAAKKVGLGRIGFSTKILNIFVEKDKAQLRNFLLGAALTEDVHCVKNSSALDFADDMTVVVHASDPLGRALCDVLEEEGCFKQVKLYEVVSEVPLVAIGAKTISDIE